MAKTLIEAAYGDLKNVKLILSGMNCDDSIIDIAGYHLQQCVEKSLKAILERCGMDYRDCGHSIGKCYRIVCNNAPDVLSVDSVSYLSRNSGVLTDWEIAGRYPSDFVFELSALKQDLISVERIFDECAAWLGYEYKSVGKVTKKPETLRRLNLNGK